MSQDETMKLTAELVDRYSGPLKEMQKRLKEMSATAKGAHDAGSKAAREHAHRVKELREQVGHLKDRVASVLNPALATLGITSLAAGDAIQTLGEKLREAGERYNVFNEAIKRSGTSAGYIDAIAASFERFGVSPERAIASVSELGEHLDKLTSGNPDELNAMNSAFSNMGTALHQALDGATSREDQMNRLFNFFANRKTPVWERRKFFEAIGIPPELASQSGAELGKVFREEFAREAAHPINLPLMKQLDEAFTKLRESQENFWRDIVSTFGPNAIKVIDGFSDAIGHMADHVKDELRDVEAIMGAVRKVLEIDDKISNAVKKALGAGDDDVLGSAVTPLLRRLGLGQTPNDRVAGGFAAFDDKKQVEATAEGTKQGVLDAIREMTAAQSFAGGYMPMAYHPDGAIAAAQRAFGGGGYRLLPNGDTGSNLPGAPAEGSNADKGVGGIDLGAGLGGSDYLKAHRQRFADAMNKNPQLRKEIAGMMLTEGARDPVPVVESLFNRAEYTGKSLEQLLHSGFYGPINRGQLPAAMARLARDPKLRARMDAAIDAALAGSNLIKGATDQGMRSDPNGRWPGGLIDRGHGNIFNDISRMEAAIQWGPEYLIHDPDRLRLVQAVAFALAHGLSLDDIAGGMGMASDRLSVRYGAGLAEIALRLREKGEPVWELI